MNRQWNNLRSQDLLVKKSNIEKIRYLMEDWFECNDVPMRYRMSVPLIILAEEINNEDGKAIFISSVAELFNHEVGNC